MEFVEPEPATEFFDTCPPASLLFRLLGGDLASRYAPLVERHLARCSDCDVKFRAARRAFAAPGEAAGKALISRPVSAPAGPGPTPIAYLSALDYTYALIGECAAGNAPAFALSFEPARSDPTGGGGGSAVVVTDEPARELFPRRALFAAADNPALPDLLLWSERHTDETPLFVVDVVAARNSGDWIDRPRRGGPPHYRIRIGFDEAVKMTEWLMGAQGRYLSPRNAAVVAGLAGVASLEPPLPEEAAGPVTVLLGEDDGFDMQKYEDYLIDSGRGRLVRTP